MFKKSMLILFSVSIIFTMACGEKKPNSLADTSTPNIRTFPLPFQKIWKTTLETVEFEFLMGIEMQEVKRGFFSTEMIRDYQPFQKRRFRLSGTLVFDGQGTIVKLYKHEEILINDEWKAIPSNNTLESQVLDRIAKKLSGK
jgi:hypothetical protein